MTPRPTLFLVCNAHIDPVWLWPWQEGLAQTLSTFRAAAAFCESDRGFVFCHNEALLYQWVEAHEPTLFARIAVLVRAGRWHVMGGWYVQPDCNLPCGESIVRQALVGKRYFLDRFGVEPRVGVNLDPFGHSRGLVQILKKSGFDGYLFCRPDAAWLTLPADDFRWIGYDGSSVVAHRAADHYNSSLGRAGDKVAAWLATHTERETGLLLWGVGNHGGGPSRADLDAIARLAATAAPARAIVHGRPEDYLAALESRADSLPAFAGNLQPWAVGCYTSMAAVKRQHRHLEGQYRTIEKLATEATVAAGLAYPRRDLDDSLDDLLFSEFHDSLPGSSVAEVEAQVRARLGHAQTILDRLGARLFFDALAGEPPAADGDYPVFVQNPHPFTVDDVVVCELQPPEPNTDPGSSLVPSLLDTTGAPIDVQVEKESCNIQTDQRKRLVFQVTLPPSSMSRFTCRLARLPRTAGAEARPIEDTWRHLLADGEVVVSGRTGLVESFRAGGIDLLAPEAARPLVLADTADPWGMKVRAFREVVGAFRLMSPERAAAFAGVSSRTLAPVRVIETGPVRTVVEALFAFGSSALCQRYVLPARGTGFEVELHVFWFERDRMLKLAFPTRLAGARVTAESMYGADEYDESPDERIGHRWLHLAAPGGAALTVVNDATYGFDFDAGELRLSLLRSPAYAGHPVDALTPIVRQDRFEARIDQGAHRFRFRIGGGPAADRRLAVPHEAAVLQSPPPALNAFPAGAGSRARGGLALTGGAVSLGALKVADDGRRLVVRLFEPTGRRQSVTLTWPALALHTTLEVAPFEIKTLALDRETGEMMETDLLERPRTAHDAAAAARPPRAGCGTVGGSPDPTPRGGRDASDRDPGR